MISALGPPDLDEAKNPIEMAQIWITPDEGDSYISLNYGIFGDQELKVWGSLAADMIAHAVRAHILDGNDISPDEAFVVIERAFREQLSSNPTLKGHFPGQTVS